MPVVSPQTLTEQLYPIAAQKIDLEFDMGATEVEIPVTTKAQHFSRSWLRQYTRARPRHGLFVQGIGDSMTPMLHNSDLTIIETSEQMLRVPDKSGLWRSTAKAW